MHDTPIERRRLADIRTAIDRAKAYTEAQGIPLTVERLAAEMDMDLHLFHRILQGILLAVSPRPRAGQGHNRRQAAPPAGWEHTRNFLYYDGTVMPTSKEEQYE